MNDVLKMILGLVGVVIREVELSNAVIYVMTSGLDLKVKVRMTLVLLSA